MTSRHSELRPKNPALLSFQRRSGSSHRRPAPTAAEVTPRLIQGAMMRLCVNCQQSFGWAERFLIYVTAALRVQLFAKVKS